MFITSIYSLSIFRLDCISVFNISFSLILRSIICFTLDLDILSSFHSYSIVYLFLLYHIDSYFLIFSFIYIIQFINIQSHLITELHSSISYIWIFFLFLFWFAVINLLYTFLFHIILIDFYWILEFKLLTETNYLMIIIIIITLYSLNHIINLIMIQLLNFIHSNPFMF